MAFKRIKINPQNADCRDIYFDNSDDLFGGKEITEALTCIKRDYKFILMRNSG
ncbi:Uncharacterised protein [Helicobacter acinonychis]|nr:Uncharacterised protein [Helicobacter acinonychis]